MLILQARMYLFGLLLYLLRVAFAEDAPTERSALMERLVKSLPHIPDVIQGQMQGKPDELKKMISSMLGDGLLSQLVVNPMSKVAQNMDTLVSKNSTASPLLDIFGSFTPSTTTTQKVMYVDGVPIKDFDDFIRKHDLESNGYTTSKPPTTTTFVNSQDIANAVFQKLKAENPSFTVEQPHPRVVPRSDLANRLDMNMIDPQRVAEVNDLLRRAPQRPETMDSLALGMDVGPPGILQPLDPTVNEVVTDLRTKGAYGLTVEDVKRLQNLLQTYEQTLQTKELLSRRKQLQVLQNELDEQRKRIEIQRLMEGELRRKEKELEAQKIKMEEQLKEQLSSWHSAFAPNNENRTPPIPLELAGYSMPPSTEVAPVQQILQVASTPHIETTTPHIELVSSHERRLTEEREHIVEQQMSDNPSSHKISSALRSHVRYSATPVIRAPFEGIPLSTAVERDEYESRSKCECETLSLERMRGAWVLALASQNIVDAMHQKASELLKAKTTLTCARFDVAGGKRSVAAQDARLQWQFRTKGSNKIQRLRGNALTMDHKSVRIQIRDFDGENFSFPFCVLRSSEGDKYEYMVVTDSRGDCKDVALLVRDPEAFFDSENKELALFLKSKILRKEINAPEVVDFANNCE